MIVFSLADQAGLMTALNERRKALGLHVWELEMKSGVSASAFFSWAPARRSIRASRSPSFLCLVAIAQTLGFAILLRHASGSEHAVQSAKAIMAFVNAKRRSRGLTAADCEKASGVSSATYYPLARGKRDPRVATLVAIASALDYDLALRAIS